jgi:hypothetical protein
MLLDWFLSDSYYQSDKLKRGYFNLMTRGGTQSFEKILTYVLHKIKESDSHHIMYYLRFLPFCMRPVDSDYQYLFDLFHGLLTKRNPNDSYDSNLGRNDFNLLRLVYTTLVLHFSDKLDFRYLDSVTMYVLPNESNPSIVTTWYVHLNDAYLKKPDALSYDHMCKIYLQGNFSDKNRQMLLRTIKKYPLSLLKLQQCAFTDYYGYYHDRSLDLIKLAQDTLSSNFQDDVELLKANELFQRLLEHEQKRLTSFFSNYLETKKILEV